MTKYSHKSLAQKAHTLSVTAVAAAKTETPTDSELLAAFNALPDAKSGDKFRYTTPENHIIDGEIVGGVVYRDRSNLANYPDDPDPNNFTPLTHLTVTKDGVRTMHYVNAGGTALIEGEYIGAGGSGASVKPDWNALPDTDAEILNKPTITNNVVTAKTLTATNDGQKSYALDVAPTNADTFLLRIAGGLPIAGRDFTAIIGSTTLTLSDAFAATIVAGSTLEARYT